MDNAEFGVFLSNLRDKVRVEDTVVPQTRYAVILLMRRVAQFVYDEGTSAVACTGEEFIAYLQASATVERLLRELEAE